MSRSTVRFFFQAGLLAIFLLTTRSSQAQRGATGSTPISIDSVHDVVQAWSTETPLFIKGNIGVSEQQLVELHRWLRVNGPHWTIVLLTTAAGEVYEAPDGRQYADLDAVEYALGKGLSNRTGFGALEHPVTQEKDGTVFVLFLRERKFSYFSSDAQDRRGVGKSRWIGELDRPAFRAMSNGGRIVDAVKDTVKTINGRLNQAIQAEADAAKRVELEQRRAIDFLKSGLVTAEASIKEIDQKSNVFRSEHPSATGPLTNPPIVDWRKVLASIESELTPDRTRANEQGLAKVADELARYLNAFAASGDLETKKKRLESNIHSIQDSPNGVAVPFVETTNKLLKAARDKSQNGELDVADSIVQAEKSLAEADHAIQQENRRLEQEQLRRLWIRRTVLSMLAILGAALAILLWFLNRKRRPSMEAAKKAFIEREQSVRKETDHLDQLFQRNAEILGSREKVVERGYTGLTRQVSEKAFDYVDDLFIMSKEVNRVMEDARELVFPKNPISRLINLFSSFRYLQGINHLSGTPLKFTKRGGLPWILRDQISAATGGNESISESALPDEVALTFENVFQAFKQRGVDAQSSLTRMEDSLANVHDSLEVLHKKLELATQREQRLATAAHQDGYFGIPKFVEVLLPSIQTDLASADQLSTFDAVQAVEGPIPIASRKLGDADLLSNQLEVARRELFPKLTKAAADLKGIGYTSNWMDTALDEITIRADELIDLASKETIVPGVDDLKEAIGRLESTTQRCVELARGIQDEHRPSLASFGQRIVDARIDLGNALKLPSESILRELDRDPDDCLSRAKDNVEAARTMLIQGRSEAAASAIETMKMELKQADFILRESKQAVESFNKDRLANLETLANVRTRSGQLAKEIAAAKQAYAASALLVHYSEARSANGSAPTRAKIGEGIDGMKDSKPGGDILPGAKKMADSLVAEVNTSTQDIQRLLELSEPEHQQGQVLKAAERAREAEQLLKNAQGMQQSVADHLEKLEGQSRENLNRQQQCEASLVALQNASQDPLVTDRTMRAIEQVSSGVQLNRQDLDSPKAAPNPFESAKVIESVQIRLKDLQSQIIADRQGHAEASRAVAGAERQLEVARQFVERSQRDGIADSQLTTQLNQRILQYAQQLVSVRQWLRTPHGDWQSVDDQASQLQADISKASDKLSEELKVAHQALQAFQQASQSVFQAEQWSGAFGMRISGSPGVNDLERARVGLQSGAYQNVLELSRVAASVAQAAIMQAEREIARRRMEEERAAEMARRAREAARWPRTSSRDFGGGFGGSFGSGFGGSSGGGSSHRSGGGGGSSSSGGNTSGFSRSGW